MRNTQTALEPRLQQQHCDSLTKHIPALSCELSWGGSTLEADAPLPSRPALCDVRRKHLIAGVVFSCHHGDAGNRQVFSSDSFDSFDSFDSLTRQRRQISRPHHRGSVVANHLAACGKGWVCVQIERVRAESTAESLMRWLIHHTFVVKIKK